MRCCITQTRRPVSHRKERRPSKSKSLRKSRVWLSRSKASPIGWLLVTRLMLICYWIRQCRRQSACGFIWDNLGRNRQKTASGRKRKIKYWRKLFENMGLETGKMWAWSWTHELPRNAAYAGRRKWILIYCMASGSQKKMWDWLWPLTLLIRIGCRSASMCPIGRIYSAESGFATFWIASWKWRNGKRIKIYWL